LIQAAILSSNKWKNHPHVFAAAIIFAGVAKFHMRGVFFKFIDWQVNKSCRPISSPIHLPKNFLESIRQFVKATAFSVKEAKHEFQEEQR
jgi:hypothetical protein